MLIYFITILLLFSFSIAEIFYTLSSGIRRWMIVFAYFILVTQVGLRWETGTDWYPYLNHFKSISNLSSTSPLLNGFEFGYNFLIWIVKQILPNYSFFLLLNAILYYFLVFKSFQRYTLYLFLSLMMFYTLSMGILGSNRQLIALAICIYAVKYVFEKKPFLFLLLIGLAISFHTSAIIFLIYYFLNREIKPLVLILILICSFIIGKSQLPLLIFTNIGDLIGGYTSTKTLLYLEGSKGALAQFSLSIFGLFKRLLFLTFFYYNRKILSEKLEYYNIMLNGYFAGIVFYLLFSDSLLIMISRGSLFFNVMEPLLFASQICLFKGKKNKVIAISILLVFAFLFFFQSIASYSDLFLPYKGIFVNTDFYRIMY